MQNTTNISAPLRRARRAGPKNRRGAAVTELAFCLPVLVAVGFGMLETCNLVFVQARMQSAAFESVRYATRPTTSTNLAATASQVQASCTSLLAQLGVQGATVTLNPSSLANLVPETLVTVTISAPFSQNSVTSMIFSGSMVLSASATMIVE